MFGAEPVKTPQRISFLLIPEFSMMAFTSCVEPLRVANRLAGKCLYALQTVSASGETVEASNGVLVVPDDSVMDEERPDCLFVCAGLNAERFRDEAVLELLRHLAAQGVQLGALCTGSLLLARAGLLDGYRCTVHWENMEGFVEDYPNLSITATLYEIDRDRYTCSGGTAPLDMMINTIAKDHGEELAISVAEQMLHNLVRHPHDAQRMSLQHRTGITHPKLLAAIAHMEAFLETPISLVDLASAVGLSTRQLERLFREKLGKKPSRYYLELRLHRARLLLMQTSMPVLQIAVACGFTSAAHFAKCYRQYFGKAPSAERAVVERLPA